MSFQRQDYNFDSNQSDQLTNSSSILPTKVFALFLHTKIMIILVKYTLIIEHIYSSIF